MQLFPCSCEVCKHSPQVALLDLARLNLGFRCRDRSGNQMWPTVKLVAALVGTFALAAHALTFNESGMAARPSHFHAVEEALLSEDRAAFQAGLVRPLTRNVQRQNAVGQAQPFAETLYVSIRCHDMWFAAILKADHSALHRNASLVFHDGSEAHTHRPTSRGYWACLEGDSVPYPLETRQTKKKVGKETDGMRWDLPTVCFGGSEDSEMPKICSDGAYTGPYPTAFDSIHVVVYDQGTFHATVRVGDRLFNFDPLVKRRGSALEVVEEEATEENNLVSSSGMVMKHNPRTDLLSMFLSDTAIQKLGLEEAEQKGGVDDRGMVGGRRSLAEWGKVQRWLDCWPGQWRSARLAVGFALDPTYMRQIQQQGYTADEALAVVLGQVNTIYQPQLGIQLVATNVHIFYRLEPGVSWVEDTVVDNYGTVIQQCPTRNVMKKLEMFRAWTTAFATGISGTAGLWHMLSGCSFDNGSMGTAFVGQLCNIRYGVALSSSFLLGAIDFWPVIAHEIG